MGVAFGFLLRPSFTSAPPRGSSTPAPPSRLGEIKIILIVLIIAIPIPVLVVPFVVPLLRGFPSWCIVVDISCRHLSCDSSLLVRSKEGTYTPTPMLNQCAPTKPFESFRSGSGDDVQVNAELRAMRIKRVHSQEFVALNSPRLRLPLTLPLAKLGTFGLLPCIVAFWRGGGEGDIQTEEVVFGTRSARSLPHVDILCIAEPNHHGSLGSRRCRDAASTWRCQLGLRSDPPSTP